MSQTPLDANDLIAVSNAELLRPQLTPALAKLYSHYNRLRAGRPGLGSWTRSEAQARLFDAEQLLEIAFAERNTEGADRQNAARRAAEILEWLSPPAINVDGLPLRLLSAAAYQVAGYSARAAGLLRDSASEEVNESRILRTLLSGDFVGLLRAISSYWASSIGQLSTPPSITWEDANQVDEDMQRLIVREIASALGVLCTWFRWHTDQRLDRALAKLEAVGGIMRYGDDPYGRMLARLCSEVAKQYRASALRVALANLTPLVNEQGQRALERYARSNYLSGRALLWPSQQVGVEQIQQRRSFALCTPTGSGKTTVAEIAILYNLFSQDGNERADLFSLPPAPLVIYIVPTRALAAEVESKLARIFRRISNPRIIVTGLYGGTDWGPTDAWVTNDEPTVLICTYEKAEALLRFLGARFMQRLSLVVIDEAHSVQFDGPPAGLQQGENRALRLESLGARLFSTLDNGQARIIALSAVARGSEQALAHWVGHTEDTRPVEVLYQSTRQLVGRLICRTSRDCEIRYDLMDRRPLEFVRGGDSTPYIPRPFPTVPPAPAWDREGPEKRLRPYLLWAAMHFAAPERDGPRRAVLISVTQQPGGYAGDFLTLIERTWAGQDIPQFFHEPTDPESMAFQLWNRCLSSCEDYYGTLSREYRLLRRGIIVHHGKMPGLMARLLVEVISERIVHIVVATSTLSEGVNLPFETILLPTVLRRQYPLSIREFANLVGRAGRPGVSTEGRCLVLMTEEGTIGQTPRAYRQLINQIQVQSTQLQTSAMSPLAELLRLIQDQWRRIVGNASGQSFEQWLEQTEPLNAETVDTQTGEATPSESPTETLDVLDSILLAAIAELEQIAGTELEPTALEEQLQRIWGYTYARYAAMDQRALATLFVTRGQTLVQRIYPSVTRRRRLYRTNLPPRSAQQLLNQQATIVEHLQTGTAYAIWDGRQRLAYIQQAAALIRAIPKFRDDRMRRGQPAWEAALLWWLNPTIVEERPTPTNIASWHDLISQQFQYRLSWGLGSVVALAMDDAFGGSSLEPSLETWPQVQLPWIVFWLKELLVWGTTEPVAAYALSRGLVTTRAQGEQLAERYAAAQTSEGDTNERLNAARIRDWVTANVSSRSEQEAFRPPLAIRAELLRDFSKSTQRFWRIVPVDTADHLYWLDPAGFPLAQSERPLEWSSAFLDHFDFLLDTDTQTVLYERYL